MNDKMTEREQRMYQLLRSCLAYFDDMRHGNIRFKHGGVGELTGAVFAPDEAWVAPIRALLREIEG